MPTAQARERFRKIRVRFAAPPARLALADALRVTQNGREAEILANGNSERLLAELQALGPEDVRCESLALEEIFVASRALTSSAE